MSVGQTFSMTCRALAKSLAQRADAAFGKSVPAVHDEMARGEFISAFICERGLTFPTAGRSQR